VLLHLLAVVTGEVVGYTLPLFWINLSGILSLVGLGLWALRPNDEAEEHTLAETHVGAFPDSHCYARHRRAGLQVNILVF
jgi:hypothetical protein